MTAERSCVGGIPQFLFSPQTASFGTGRERTRDRTLRFLRKPQVCPGLLLFFCIWVCSVGEV